MKVKFYLHNDPKSNNPEKSIIAYIRGFGKSQTITVNTHKRINPKNWSAMDRMPKPSYDDYYGLKDYLKNIESEILNFEKDIRKYTFEELKTEILRCFRLKEEERRISFFDIFDKFLQSKRTEIGTATINKYRYLKNHLQDFETSQKIKITKIDANLLKSFSDYLLIDKRQVTNTVSKYVKMLKSVLTWITENHPEILISNDYKKIKCKNHEIDIVVLNEYELQRIIDMDLSNEPRLMRVRDAFVFSCNCGIRVSDLFRLKKADVINGFWNLRTQKTKDILRIPLNNLALEILNKYDVFPRISTQKYNEYIKEVCKLASIDDIITITKYRGAEKIEYAFPKYELISSHTGRRTFCTLSLQKGMRPETVMKITGHKNYSTFKKYIAIADNVAKNEMDLAWNEPPESAAKIMKIG